MSYLEDAEEIVKAIESHPEESLHNKASWVTSLAIRAYKEGERSGRMQVRT